MTSTRQHIEDLGDEDWAALAKRVAEDVVADAAQSGTTPPAALAAVAAMTEGELVEHRRRHGPARKRLSPVMQLVAADQRAVIAEAQAQEARQEKLDADAAAEMARAQSAQSAELASAARQRVRDVEALAARKDAERVEERAAEQQALLQLRGELERARAEHAAELAAAREQVLAADTRAEERLAERAAERQAAQQAQEQLRAELERARAEHAAELAAAVGKAAGQVAGAQEAAEAEIARARAEVDDAQVRAQVEIEQARAEAAERVSQIQEQADAAIANAHQSAQAEAAQLAAATHSFDPADALLAIPIPPMDVRGHTGPIEDALSTVRQLDYVLEAGLGDDLEPRDRVNAEVVRPLAQRVHDEAMDLSQELRGLTSRYTEQQQIEAARGYVKAAAKAYGALLQRIETAIRQLDEHGAADSGVVESVTQMLTEHPWRRSR